MKATKRIFIIAGEASGDMLGASLLSELQQRYGHDLEVRGVGGEKMEACGFVSLFPMKDIALIGFMEIIPHSINVLCRIKETCEALFEFRPDIVITIDSPGFNYRVINWVRKGLGASVTCVHYVAPTVWAYKPERAAKTAALFDHLMVLLPFEKRYFDAHGLPTTFVGHPVADDLGINFQWPRPYIQGEPLNVMMFPGSRKGEIEKMMPIFEEALDLLQKDYPDMYVTIPTTKMMLPHIKTDHWRRPPALVINDEQRDHAFSQAHIALTKTGTVTLEIAKFGVPMVAAYKVNSLTARIVKRMLNIPFVNLINIIVGKEVIPELLQDECNASALYQEMRLLIEEYDEALSQTHLSIEALSSMQNDDHILASAKAADVINEYLTKKQPSEYHPNGLIFLTHHN